MSKKEKKLRRIHEKERELELLRREVDSLVQIRRIRQHYDRMTEAIENIPPLTHDQVHALISSSRLTQFELRRKADGLLLAFCLLLLALGTVALRGVAVSAAGRVVLLVLAVADLWVALRAARSLWLLWLTHRLRFQPARMVRYAGRLARLFRRRRLWLGFILWGARNRSSEYNWFRTELRAVRIPSYAVAACMLLFFMFSSKDASAYNHDYDKVTTTTGETDKAICDTVNQMRAQL